MVRKIFLDSRFRDSGTFANFQTTLKTAVVHPKCRAYIDQIHIPNVFPTIHANNRHLYILESWVTAGNPPVGNFKKRKIPLTEGNYDLASLGAELQTQLNANTFFPTGNTYAVTHSTSTGKLTIALSGPDSPEAAIWSMQYLKAHRDLWVDSGSNQVGVLVDDDDCYTAIGFTHDGILNVTTSASRTGNAHVSILPFHSLYLHNDFGLGSNEDSIGPRGGNILRSIVVNTGFGNMIHDQLQNPFDFTALEAGQLTSFGFALRDIHGRDVPLNQGFSFSILLVEEE